MRRGCLTALAPGAAPVRVEGSPFLLADPRVLRAVESRHVVCRHYDGCLDHAVVQGWASWTCGEGCRAHEDLSRDEQRLDLDGLAKALTRIMSPEGKRQKREKRIRVESSALAMGLCVECRREPHREERQTCAACGAELARRAWRRRHLMRSA